MKKYFLVFCFLFFGVCSAHAFTFADYIKYTIKRIHYMKSKECEIYATISIEQIKTHTKYNCPDQWHCGKHGGTDSYGWSPVYNDHFGFCHSLAFLMNEKIYGREAVLKECCPQAPNGHIRCVAYAYMAVFQQLLNKEWGCGFHDKYIWTPSFKQHYRWCLDSDQSKERLDWETKNRMKMLLDQCE